MQQIPEYARNFANLRIYEAIYRTEQKEEIILLESRITPLEKELWFTIVDDKQIRSHSIYELVHSLPSLVSLTIPHSVRLLWNGDIKRAELMEVFKPSRDPEHIWVDSLQLKLSIDSKTYETEMCDTLQDALLELEEESKSEAEWWLCTCYDCEYSGHARDYLVSDREYWCYRDVPEAYAEMRAKGKYSRMEVRFEGTYFVNAFHTCAAWKSRQIVSAAEEKS